MKLTENRWLTGRGFGVHSPWAYDLIENESMRNVPITHMRTSIPSGRKPRSICRSIRRAVTNCCSDW